MVKPGFTSHPDLYMTPKPICCVHYTALLFQKVSCANRKNVIKKISLEILDIRLTHGYFGSLNAVIQKKVGCAEKP